MQYDLTDFNNKDLLSLIDVGYSKHNIDGKKRICNK